MIDRWIDAGGAAPIVVRRADSSSRRELESIATRLRAAAHPGVVQVVSSAPMPDGGWELRTAHGGTPLAATGPIEASRLAAIGSRVATTLADLHDHGIAHGRLTATRILVGPHDRAMLCGFGGDDASLELEEEVAALGRILADQLAAPASSRHATHTARKLRAALDQASDPSASRRPSMRRLAASLAALATVAGPPTRQAALPDRHRRPGSQRPHASSRQLALLGAVILVLALGAVRSRLNGGPDARGLEPAPTTTSVATTTTSPPASCAVVEGRAAAPAAGCPHTASIVDDVVTIDGTEYRVGIAGDVIAVGSWRCAGDATIALLRPASGSVFVFPAATTVPLTVEPMATVPGAVDLDVVDIGAWCQELRVVDSAGTATAVMLRPSA